MPNTDGDHTFRGWADSLPCTAEPSPHTSTSVGHAWLSTPPADTTDEAVLSEYCLTRPEGYAGGGRAKHTKQSHSEEELLLNLLKEKILLMLTR